jgi:serine/threonine protein kinase
MTNQHRARLHESQSVQAPESFGGGTGPRARRDGTELGFATGFANAGARKHCPVCGERYPADFRVCPRDATALATVLGDSDPLIGMVLGDTYDVLGVIGEGATGRVYEAAHTRLRAKHYAIKVMYSDLTRQPAVVERFLREAQATSVLSHPNIVSALDIGQTEDGRPFIVSELLHGVQLGEYLARSGQLSVPEAVRIVRQACQALIAAHDKGIVHRDIKPGNLFLVGTAGATTVKVLDFGISLVGDASLTKTGMIMGTPAYMPPEQASGTRVDHRADIYALATVMYEALTGCKAFTGADPIATLAGVLTRDAEPPRSLNEAIPPELELVIQRAMAKLPSQRYRSMRELDAALAVFDVRSAAPSLLEAGPGREGEIDLGEELSLELELELGEVIGEDDDVAAAEPAPPAADDLAAPRQADATERTSRPRKLPNLPLPEALARMLGADALDHARSKLVWFAWALGVTALLGSIDATTSAIRLSRGGAPLTGTEIVLATLGSLGLLVMPTWLFGHYVSAHVWSSTPRVLDTIRRMRRVLFAGLVTYAAGTLLVRVFAGVLSSDLSSAGSAGWGLLLVVVAASAGARTGWRELQRAGMQES